MKAKLTFLGSGTSQGIPNVGCTCDVCRSKDPRDTRLRASVLVEYGGLTILVDAGPDFRYQMLRQGVNHLDAILLTHAHMDHIGGLDDVRALNLIEHHPVNIYCEQRVKDSLKGMFPYAFAEPRYQGAPEWNVHVIDSNPFIVHSNSVDEILEWQMGKGYRHLPPDPDAVDTPMEVVPIQGWHHDNRDQSVLGYRFGNIAYLTDMKVIDDCELEKLQGLDAITLGCVKKTQHYSHPSLDFCLEFFEKVGAKQSYITHISHLLPKYVDFEAELPENVHPAYDGLVLDF